MNEHRILKKHEIAKKAAEIASQVIGFPYVSRRPTEEGTAWEVHANDRLYHSVLKKKYGRDYYYPPKKIQREIGMNFNLSSSIGRVKYKKSGLVEFESDIMLDLSWSIEEDDFPIPFKVIPQLDNSKNWPKWKGKIPITMTMLEKCHQAAKEVSERSGVKIVVKRDEYSETSDEYVFKTCFDAKNMAEEKFLGMFQKHCKEMVRAYKKYEPWLTGSEYKKLIQSARSK